MTSSSRLTDSGLKSLMHPRQEPKLRPVELEQISLVRLASIAFAALALYQWV